MNTWSVEVGCRDCLANSLAAFLTELALTGRRRKTSLNDLGEKAEEASRMICLWSNNEGEKASGGQAAVAADGAPD